VNVEYIRFNTRARFQSDYKTRAQQLPDVIWSLQRISNKVPVYVVVGEDAYDYIRLWVNDFDIYSNTDNTPLLSGVELRVSKEIPSNSIFLAYGDDLGNKGILIENMYTDFSLPYDDYKGDYA